LAAFLAQAGLVKGTHLNFGVDFAILILTCEINKSKMMLWACGSIFSPTRTCQRYTFKLKAVHRVALLKLRVVSLKQNNACGAW